jgi:hypothetical protein
MIPTGMEGAQMAQTIPNDDASLRLAIREVLDEINAARAEMARDQREIDRLRAESAALKAKSHSLRSQTRAVLASVKAALDA